MSLTNSLPKRSPTCLADLSEERARIARELHDGIAQDLAAIGYALDSEIGRADVTYAARKSMRLIREQITALNSAVRQEIFLLRSPRGLNAHEALAESLKSLGIPVAISGTLPESESGFELFKVIQEISRNSSSHGKAASIQIHILPASITIENDGEGDSTPRLGGVGLQGVKERLKIIGWKIAPNSNFKYIELHCHPTLL